MSFRKIIKTVGIAEVIVIGLFLSLDSLYSSLEGPTSRYNETQYIYAFMLLMALKWMFLYRYVSLKSSIINFEAKFSAAFSLVVAVIGIIYSGLILLHYLNGPSVCETSSGCGWGMLLFYFYGAVAIAVLVVGFIVGAIYSTFKNSN